MKILLGLLSLVELATLFLFAGFFGYLVVTNDATFLINAIEHHPVLVALFNLTMPVIQSAPFVYFLVHAARNPELSDRRVTWILFMLFLSPFALPVYWYHFVWHDSYYET